METWGEAEGFGINLIPESGTGGPSYPPRKFRIGPAPVESALARIVAAHPSEPSQEGVDLRSNHTL